MKTLRRLEATEADTLKTITDFLDLQMAQGKLLYIRHSPSNVIGKKGEATFRKPRASQLGAPDLIVFKRKAYLDREISVGYTDILCIEVKSAIGKLSTAQERWAEKAVDQGCRYIVVRSLEDVSRELSLTRPRNLLGWDGFGQHTR